MRNNSVNPLYSTPSAILVGSLLVTIAILIHGGFIKLGGFKAPVAQPTPQVSAQPAAQQPARPTITLNQVKEAFNKSVIKFGDTNKKLIILEIADPSCPFCQIAAGKNGELNKQVGTRFTLVSDGGTYVAPVPEIRKLVNSGSAGFAYIYTPGHGNGEMGTKAMYCAFEKGKFWEVHDLIMTSAGYDLMNNTVKNDKTKSQDVANFLQSVFDPAIMKTCLDSGKYDKQLQNEVSLASSLGVNGTPGFFLNATPFAGAYSYTDMESAVKTALGN